ncbi:MAG TPA: altronate dehydratase family protein [Blastocatellia bacterium]|nr:altronate dehydratase family protein [Blastocatellia bacterium]
MSIINESISPFLVLNEKDNVGVARTPVPDGTEVPIAADVPDHKLTARATIVPGHKVALRPIPAGTLVTKYGETIGRATTDIGPGEWVHTHNVTPDFTGKNYEYATQTPATEYFTPEEAGTFMGYLRENGDVGTRNYVAVIATSNCSSHVATEIAYELRHVGPETHGIDGVVAIPHQEGCGHSEGEDTWQLERTIAGMIFHPNVGAVLMVSLGCEVNQISKYLGTAQLGQQAFRKGKLIVGLEMQSSGGTRRTIAGGVAQVETLIKACQEMKRTPQPMSKILLGTNCGGSDAFSGISANPALGRASDLLVRSGGTSVLAEIPECMGAEHLLTRRAVDPATGRKVIDVMEWYESYLRRFGGGWNDNPSPGNKAGGLTNITEKSLGAVAKGGTTALTGVFAYAERVNRPGFVLMNTPGYDPVSLTGIAAGGANLICFTTGRGSGIGFPVVPVIKISSNSRIAGIMEDNIDINAGTIVEGKETISEVGGKIFETLRRIASGERTKSELLGHKEFVPWRVGPVL